MQGETQARKGISYYRTRDAVHGKRIYMQLAKAEASLERLLDKLAIGPEGSAAIQNALRTVVGQEQQGKEDELKALQKREKRLRDAGRTLIRMHSMGDVS
jgi:hypothetical protein